MTRCVRARVLALALAVTVMVASAVGFVAATRNQVSGHCLAFETIGGLHDGFPAAATVIGDAVLLAHARPDQAPQLRVGQDVAVPDTLAATEMRAWVVAVHGPDATITVQPPPQIAVVTPTPPANLRLGATGQVTISTLSISKTQLEPTAALRPVEGRPGLVVALASRGRGPARREALYVLHAVGPYAETSPADPATALSVGADPQPTAGQGALLIPDHFCRTVRLWPPVLTHDIVVNPAP